MKIVVRGTNWIGDAVMTIPAMRQLRRIFPAAKIFLHTRNWAEGIFRDADFIDEILPFEKDKSTFKTIRRQAKIWRQMNFDLAVIFTNSFQTALLAKLGKAQKSYGYKNEARGFLLTDPVSMPDWKNKRHEVFYYLNLVAEIESDFCGTKTSLDAAPEFDLKISARRKLEAEKILIENKIDTGRKIIALGVGSTNSRAKRWGAINYAKLNDKLRKNLDAEVILIVSKDEYPCM